MTKLRKEIINELCQANVDSLVVVVAVVVVVVFIAEKNTELLSSARQIK